MYTLNRNGLHVLPFVLGILVAHAGNARSLDPPPSFDWNDPIYQIVRKGPFEIRQFFLDIASDCFHDEVDDGGFSILVAQAPERSLSPSGLCSVAETKALSDVISARILYGAEVEFAGKLAAKRIVERGRKVSPWFRIVSLCASSPDGCNRPPDLPSLNPDFDDASMTDLQRDLGGYLVAMTAFQGLTQAWQVETKAKLETHIERLLEEIDARAEHVESGRGSVSYDGMSPKDRRRAQRAEDNRRNGAWLEGVMRSPGFSNGTIGTSMTCNGNRCTVTVIQYPK